jgi:hypothetical protein
MPQLSLFPKNMTMADVEFPASASKVGAAQALPGEKAAMSSMTNPQLFFSVTVRMQKY